jgi:N-carbamoyl-L-amino-acid hydrolase
MYTCNLDRVKDKISAFARYGATAKGGVTRFALSSDEIAARREFCARLSALGFPTVTDDMANMYATVPGGDPALPRLATGSHIDSVRCGGNYDGILGVIAALEVAETLVTEKIPHRHPITAMVWTNEEGSRFLPSMMASGVVCGQVKKADALAAKSGVTGDNATFAEALAASGFAGDEKNRINAREYAALLELHSEQGPIMEKAGTEIGVVEGVMGMVNYRFFAQGLANHAGTTPMAYRKDALFAAAQTIQWLHKELDRLAPDLVYTTGEMIVRPNVHTVVPEYAEFSLDARHRDPRVLDGVIDAIHRLPKEFARCPVTAKEQWRRKTVAFDKKLVGAVERTAQQFAYSHQRLYSGAGHDAQYAADLLPTAMIFVPSKDGRSHCEDEYTTLEDAWRGCNVLLNTLLTLDKD